MTDKQIIERLKTDLDFERTKRKSLQADLKDKEQEYEELKEDRERWKSNFNGKVSAIEELLQKLDQLNADREEALKQLEFVRTLNTVKETEIRKLSKTLAEIKEIAETGAKCLYATKSDDYTDGYRWLGNIILQKISECEANNDNK